MSTPTKKPRAKKAAPTTLEAIKGFHRDMTCKGYQFELGKSFKQEGKVKACKNGFHACPTDLDPLTVFQFYAPGTSRYCIVDMGGEIDRSEADKAASSEIFIRSELTVADLIDRAVKFRLAKAKPTSAASNSGPRGAASNSGPRGAASNSGNCGAASNSGYGGVASNSGYGGVASNSGYGGVASNSGNCGAASNSGYGGVASNSGNCGVASNSGYGGVASNSGYGGVASNSGYGGVASNSGNCGAAMSHAYGGKVMCEGDGQALYCTEFNNDGSIKSVACGITGRDGIVAGTWYVCRDGKLVAA